MTQQYQDSTSLHQESEHRTAPLQKTQKNGKETKTLKIDELP